MPVWGRHKQKEYFWRSTVDWTWLEFGSWWRKVVGCEAEPEMDYMPMKELEFYHTTIGSYWNVKTYRFIILAAQKARQSNSILEVNRSVRNVSEESSQDITMAWTSGSRQCPCEDYLTAQTHSSLSFWEKSNRLVLNKTYISRHQMYCSINIHDPTLWL